jgi:hypothetical protein
MNIQIGSGELRFFGLRIYTATLFATKDFNPAQYAQSPILLKIEYRRAFEGRLIAERSLLEMKRQGKIANSTATLWLDLMTKAFPDLAAGDRLSGQTDGKGAVTFMHNENPTAQTIDPEFATRFFGIWLHEATSSPELRTQLLGLTKGKS